MIYIATNRDLSLHRCNLNIKCLTQFAPMFLKTKFFTTLSSHFEKMQEDISFAPT